MSKIFYVFLIVFMYICIFSSCSSYKMTPVEKLMCNQESSFFDYKIVNQTKFKQTAERHTYDLPVNLIVYNHKRFNEGILEPYQVWRQVENARKAYRQCDVELKVNDLRYIQGPEFLNKLDQGDRKISEKEQCLFNRFHQKNMINVFFVEEAKPVNYGHHGGHNFNQDDFNFGNFEEHHKKYIGTIVVTDIGMSNYTIEGFKNYVSQFVVAHEMGHVLMNNQHVGGGMPNLLHGELEQSSLLLTPQQCEVVKQSKFLKRN